MNGKNELELYCSIFRFTFALLGYIKCVHKPRPRCYC